MAEARNADQYTALLIPWDLDADDLVAADSSYTQDDPQPGLPEATTDGVSLQVLSEGSSDGTEYVITTRQGGNVSPGGAAFTWRKSTDSSDDDRGWDAPNLLSGHSFIDHVGTSSFAINPDAVALPSGKVLVVTSKTATHPAHQIMSYLLTPGSPATITEVSVTGTIGQPSSRISASFHPTVALLDDGSVICAHIAEDTTAELAQVDVYRSTDEGATWTLISRGALPDSIDIDNATTAGATGVTIQRLRMRHTGGRTLLLVWCEANTTDASDNPDGYFQFGSDSEGTQFSFVEGAIDTGLGIIYAGEAVGNLSARFGYPDIAVLDGEFFVVWINSAEGSVFRRLHNPFEGLSEVGGAALVEASIGYTLGVFDGTGAFTEGECSIVADVDGSLYVTHSDRAVGSMTIIRSSDLGSNWAVLGGGLSAETNAWYPPSADLDLTNVVLVAARGQLFGYSNHAAPTTVTYDDSLSEWGLGGWSSVTFPGNTLFGKVTGRAAWVVAYFPGELPDNLAEWTKTSTGTPTEDISSGYLDLDATTTETVYYTHTPTTAAASDGGITEWAMKTTAGTSLSAFYTGAAARTEDASNGYSWQVRTSTTAARMYDPLGGATVTGFSNLTLSSSTKYEFRVEQRGSAIQGWYREYSTFSDRLWIDWGSGTLTDSGGSGTPTLFVRFCGKNTATSATCGADFYHARATYGPAAGVRTLPFVNPTDLQGRDYPPVGRSTVIDSNVRIYASGGPGRRGESYTYAPRYGYPIDLLFWRESLSPREKWQPVAGGGTTSIEQTIALPISSGAEDTRLGPAVGVFLGGIRAWRTGSVKFKTNAGATTTHGFDLSLGGASGQSFTRTGKHIIVGGALTSGLFVHRHEMAGWWVYLDDGAGTTGWAEIETNNEGVLAGAAGLPLRFTLVETSTTPAYPTSGTMNIVPDQAVIVIHNQSVSARRLLLTIDAQASDGQQTPLGCYWPGDIYACPDPHESGARYTTVGGGVAGEGRGRVARSSYQAPSRREFEIGWTGIAYTGAGAGLTADPNYSEATAHASAEPMGAAEMMPYTAEGIYRLCNGAERPIVYLRCLTKQGSGAQVRVTSGRWRVIPAQITGTATLREVTGLPCTTSEKMRSEALALREIV
jgi:hypothetical protein